jgi:hypothetical protein
MAIEVLGLPQSFELSQTQAMVGEAQRDVYSTGAEEPLQGMPDISPEVVFIIGSGLVAVGGLVVWAKQWLPYWQRKNR